MMRMTAEDALARAKAWVSAHPDAFNRCTDFVGGFFTADGKQSMTRAVALMCGICGCVVALAGALVSKRPHITTTDVAMAHELFLGAGILISGGAVSLLVRSKTDPVAPANAHPTTAEDKG